MSNNKNNFNMHCLLIIKVRLIWYNTLSVHSISILDGKDKNYRFVSVKNIVIIKVFLHKMVFRYS